MVPAKGVGMIVFSVLMTLIAAVFACSSFYAIGYLRGRVDEAKGNPIPKWIKGTL